MRIQILMPYYNRPILLESALKSIVVSSVDWELGFFDDNSPIPGRPIVEDILCDYLHKVSFYRSDMSLEDKIKNGLMLGKAANYFIRRSKSDIAVVLCDDDLLVPGYLEGLSAYYQDNPEVTYSYCHVYIFNPLYNGKKTSDQHLYNKYTEPIDPSGRLDASQVSWRLSCDVLYPETTQEAGCDPWIRDTDRGFFSVLFEKYGSAPFNGLIGQYKGIHDYQFVWHKKTVEELRAYDKTIRELGGVKI